MQPGPVYTLLEVPGKEELEPLTLGYYQNNHYRSLRKKRQDTFGEELLQEYQKTCKDCGKILDEKMLEKHIINHHQKKKCCFCGKKLLKKEVKEHMDKVHKKVPVKSVEYTIGPKGKTDTKTSMEWGNRNENIVDSSKKQKIYDSYKRVNNKENFKNIDIDAMEESDEEYIPSSEEEDVALTPPPREKSLRKSQYPFNCKVCDERFFFI